MANQNLPMSDEIATLIEHFVWPIFCCNIWLYHLQIKFDFLLHYSFECTSVFMSDQVSLLSDQNGALVGHMFFQGKKIICSPGQGMISGHHRHECHFHTKCDKLPIRGSCWLFLFALSSSTVLSCNFDISVNSMTNWSVLNLPKMIWPSPFKSFCWIHDSLPIFEQVQCSC